MLRFALSLSVMGLVANLGLAQALQYLPPSGQPPIFVPTAPPPAVVVPVLTPISVSQAPARLAGLPAGKHEVLFVHPKTCCPVKVCLPVRCDCYEVKVNNHLGVTKIRFKYKGLFNDVVVRFNRDGSASVDD